MDSNTTGNNNTAVGRNALYSNTTADENTAVGCGALAANTTGTPNTAVGSLALTANTTGASNTAMGRQSMQANTTGAENSAYGRCSLKANTTGPDNVAVGFKALTANTTGDMNVAIGSEAGCTITTGSNNVLVGGNTQANANNTAFEIVIGKNATGKGTNTGIIGGNSNAIYQGNNSSSWSTTSDRRIKKNIADNNIGLEKINQIQVRNFEYRTEDEITDFENTKSAVVKKQGIQIGVIAQEIEEILPDVVRTETAGVKSVDPSNLTWYLVNAIKELSETNKDLKSRIEALESN